MCARPVAEVQKILFTLIFLPCSWHITYSVTAARNVGVILVSSVLDPPQAEPPAQCHRVGKGDSRHPKRETTLTELTVCLGAGLGVGGDLPACRVGGRQCFLKQWPCPSCPVILPQLPCTGSPTIECLASCRDRRRV